MSILFGWMRSVGLRGIGLVVVMSLRGSAQVGGIGYHDLRPDDAPITFSNVKVGTHDPVVRLANNTVWLGSTFVGQKLGKEPNTLFESNPEGPLRLDPHGPQVGTLIDFASRSIVVGGMTQSGGMQQYFTTPIAMLFEQAVQAVGFRAGAFDHPYLIIAEAYTHDGKSIGRLTNDTHGSNWMGIKSYGEKIGGVSLFVPDGGMDWEGFGVDDIHMERGAEIPEPVSLIAWGTLASFAGAYGWWLARKTARVPSEHVVS